MRKFLFIFITLLLSILIYSIYIEYDSSNAKTSTISRVESFEHKKLLVADDVWPGSERILVRNLFSKTQDGKYKFKGQKAEVYLSLFSLKSFLSCFVKENVERFDMPAWVKKTNSDTDRLLGCFFSSGSNRNNKTSKNDNEIVHLSFDQDPNGVWYIDSPTFAVIFGHDENCNIIRVNLSNQEIRNKLSNNGVDLKREWDLKSWEIKLLLFLRNINIQDWAKRNKKPIRKDVFPLSFDVADINWRTNKDYGMFKNEKQFLSKRRIAIGSLMFECWQINESEVYGNKKGDFIGVSYFAPSIGYIVKCRTRKESCFPFKWNNKDVDICYLLDNDYVDDFEIIDYVLLPKNKISLRNVKSMSPLKSYSVVLGD